MDASIAKQQASVAVQTGAASGLSKQRESVRRQAAALQPETKDAESSFFTIPWPLPQAAEVSEFCPPPPTRRELDYLMDSAAEKAGLKPSLVREVIRQESGFNPCAVSPKGAQGLMQLMPATAAQLQVGDAFNVIENLSAGTRLLRELLGRYNGDLASALAAYNAGPQRVDAAGGIPAIPETQKYVSDILGRLPP
ncbi:MAG: lytic transglycosylase domain-containing protein [Bryobacteraceae bacterium]